MWQLRLEVSPGSVVLCSGPMSHRLSHLSTSAHGRRKNARSPGDEARLPPVRAGPGVCVRVRGHAQPRPQPRAGGPQSASGERQLRADCTVGLSRRPSRRGPQGLASQGDSASHIELEAGQGPTCPEKWPQRPRVEGPSQQPRLVQGGWRGRRRGRGRRRCWVGGGWAPWGEHRVGAGSKRGQPQRTLSPPR